MTTTQVEKCRISFELIDGTLPFSKDLIWRADAICPQGPYVAGVSQPFIHSSRVELEVYGLGPKHDDGAKEHQQLVSQLVADGWEFEGYGADWYDHRFRRRWVPELHQARLAGVKERVTRIREKAEESNLACMAFFGFVGHLICVAIVKLTSID